MKKILISVSSHGEDYKNTINIVGGQTDVYYLPNYFRALSISIEDFCVLLSNKYDGFILGGGGDINPILFGEKSNGSIRIDDERDKIEFHLIKIFMKQEKPIMGICRGFQVMNVALGGTINQDMGSKYNAYHTSNDMTFKVHPTYCKPSFLQDLYGETFNVNSHHHQSIKRLGVDLIPIQYSGNNKCIEGVVHKSYPYIGVQWHPERLCKPKEKEKNCVDGTLIFTHYMSLLQN